VIGFSPLIVDLTQVIPVRFPNFGITTDGNDIGFGLSNFIVPPVFCNGDLSTGLIEYRPS
jgi:hypothetical protein